MQQELMNAIFSGLVTILVALVGVVSQKVAVYLKQKGLTQKLENKEYLVKWAVSGIEQVYQNEKGPEKFAAAKKEVIELFEKNGLSVDEDELDLLIESMVKAMNDGFHSTSEIDDIEQPKGE